MEIRLNMTDSRTAQSGSSRRRQTHSSTDSILSDDGAAENEDGAVTEGENTGGKNARKRRRRESELEILPVPSTPTHVSEDETFEREKKLLTERNLERMQRLEE